MSAGKFKKLGGNIWRYDNVNATALQSFNTIIF